MADTKAVTQLGPRLIGRLTPELILRSPQFMSCVNQYEIDLRANRVAAIENLGATEVRAVVAAPGARQRSPTPAPRALPSALLHVRLLHHPAPASPTHPGPLQNQFDTIDLSDNSIVRLEGFPKLPRLQCLYLNNNRINRIARNLEGASSRLRPCSCWPDGDPTTAAARR